MNKFIILDRDGVINQDSWSYIKSPDEFIFIPGSADAIARLTKAGYRIAVATNQSGIARGYYNEEILAAIHRKMLSQIEAVGGHIEIIEFCPHMPNSCTCRKPQPDMLLSIAKHWQHSLKNVAFVGDRISDIQVAKAVGATPVIILSNMTDRRALADYPEVPQFASLADFVDICLNDNE